MGEIRTGTVKERVLLIIAQSLFPPQSPSTGLGPFKMTDAGIVTVGNHLQPFL